jgi:probable HAF family extracellular repeat protein
MNPISTRNLIFFPLLCAAFVINVYGTETASMANAVNDFGMIVGVRFSGPSNDPSTGRATLWFRDLSVLDLGTLSDGASSVATGVNNRGQVVGYSRTATGSTHAFLWQAGVIHDLGTLRPEHVWSSANGINDHGEVVGGSCENDPGLVGYADAACRAFAWRRGTMQDLGVYPGGGYSVAQAINDKGEVVGYGDVPIEFDQTAQRGLVWANGGITEIGLLLQGTAIQATGINDRGVVIGWVVGPDFCENCGFSWKAGSVQEVITGFPNNSPQRIAAALGVNKRGEIVGLSLAGDGVAAFLVNDGNVVELPSLTSAPGSIASAINEHGLIVGYSTDGNGVSRAVMWEKGIIRVLQ